MLWLTRSVREQIYVMLNQRLEQILPFLLDDDQFDAQGEALDEFYNLCSQSSFGVDDIVWLVERAAREPLTTDPIDPAFSVLVFAREIAAGLGAGADQVVAVVARNLNRFRDSSIEAVLELLCEIPTTSSVKLYSDIITARPGVQQKICVPVYNFVALSEQVGFDESVFLKLLTEGDIHVQLRIHEAITAALKECNDSVALLSEYKPKLPSIIKQLVGEIEMMQEAFFRLNPSQRRNERYLVLQDAIWTAVELATEWDLLSSLDTINRVMLKLRDPHLRLSRAIALLNNGIDVPDDELSWVATYPSERVLLRDSLLSMDMADRLPPQCLDLQLIAESYLVNWLQFPTELGVAPDEIEFVHVQACGEERNQGLAQQMNFFLFKYRSINGETQEWEPWYVGLVGGLRIRRSGAIEYTGDTFSHFHEYDKYTIEGHYATFFEADNRQNRQSRF